LQEKFKEKMSYYNEGGIEKIIKNSFAEALVYFEEAEKLL
jgi:hypothetical protein